MSEQRAKDQHVVPDSMGIDDLRELAFGYWRQAERYRLDYEAVSSREAALIAERRTAQHLLQQAAGIIKTWHNMGLPDDGDKMWLIYWQNAPEMKPIREALMRPTVIALEDDMDQGFSALSDGCLRFECQTWGQGAKKPTHPQLMKRDGWWICPQCGGSYGAAD